MGRIGEVLTAQGRFEEAEKTLLESQTRIGGQPGCVAQAQATGDGTTYLALYESWGKPERGCRVAR